LISFGNYILTETLFSFTLLLSLYLFINLLKYKKTTLALLTGLSFGLAYLVNPVIFFAPFFLALLFYFTSTEICKKLSFYMLVSFLAIALAWSARNHVYVDSNQASTSSRVLLNLIIGSHRDFYQVWRANPRDPNNPATLDQAAAQGSIPQFLSTLWERIQQKPIDYAQWYFLEKPYYLWSWDILAGIGDIHIYPVAYSLYDQNRLALASYSIMKSIHLWLWASALMGIFFLFRFNLNIPMLAILSLYITVIYISAVYVILQADSRYSIPLRPEMYLCAMFFIMRIVEMYKKYKLEQNTQASD